MDLYQGSNQPFLLKYSQEIKSSFIILLLLGFLGAYKFTKPVRSLVDKPIDYAVAGISMGYGHFSTFVLEMTGLDLGLAHPPPDPEFLFQVRVASYINEKRAGPLLDIAVDSRLPDDQRRRALKALLKFESSSDWIQPFLNELAKGGLLGLYDKEAPELDELTQRIRAEGGIRQPMVRAYADSVLSFMLQHPKPILRQHSLHWVNDLIAEDAVYLLADRVSKETDPETRTILEESLWNVRAISDPETARSQLLRPYVQPPWPGVRAPLSYLLVRTGYLKAKEPLQLVSQRPNLSSDQKTLISIAMAERPFPRTVSISSRLQEEIASRKMARKAQERWALARQMILRRSEEIQKTYELVEFLDKEQAARRAEARQEEVARPPSVKEERQRKQEAAAQLAAAKKAEEEARTASLKAEQQRKEETARVALAKKAEEVARREAARLAEQRKREEKAHLAATKKAQEEARLAEARLAEARRVKVKQEELARLEKARKEKEALAKAAAEKQELARLEREKKEKEEAAKAAAKREELAKLEQAKKEKEEAAKVAAKQEELARLETLKKEAQARAPKVPLDQPATERASQEEEIDFNPDAVAKPVKGDMKYEKLKVQSEFPDVNLEAESKGLKELSPTAKKPIDIVTVQTTGSKPTTAPNSKMKSFETMEGKITDNTPKAVQVARLPTEEEINQEMARRAATVKKSTQRGQMQSVNLLYEIKNQEVPLYVNPGFTKVTGVVLPIGSKGTASFKVMIGEDDWYQVKYKKDTGWANGSLLTVYDIPNVGEPIHVAAEIPVTTPQLKKQVTKSVAAATSEITFFEPVFQGVLVYRDPSGQSDQVGTLEEGVAYKATKSLKIGTDRWFLLDLNKYKTGWVHGTDLQLASEILPPPEEIMDTPAPGEKYVVANSEGVPVYSKPSIVGKKIATVSPGDTYKVVIVDEGSGNEWYKIKLEGRKEGWVQSMFMTVTKSGAPKSTKKASTR